MSLPLYIAAALPITFILFLFNVWWDRHWKLRNLPTPVCFLHLLVTEFTCNNRQLGKQICLLLQANIRKARTVGKPSVARPHRQHRQ